jgi:thymidylate synthase ThyX
VKTSARIVADTMGIAGARITTFEVTCPRFLLAEINTHRVIAKSCASSRAIPVKKRIEMVEKYPFVPKAFGKNQPGMVADENLDEKTTNDARIAWNRATAYAVQQARELERLGVHKQLSNRVLEPYAYVTDCLTATEWDNFWWLRTHPDAQPEFQELARIMKPLYEAAKPQGGVNHLPYCEDILKDHDLATLFLISSARCARNSYKTFEGKVSSAEDDKDMCEKLIASAHLSPFDHAAVSDSVYWDHYRGGWFWRKPNDHRHLWGWIPHRVRIEQQLGLKCKRNSHEAINVDLIT